MENTQEYFGLKELRSVVIRARGPLTIGNREFEDGEEQDNIDGGERMHKVLNIIGRVFDDVKRNIDLIKNEIIITVC